MLVPLHVKLAYGVLLLMCLNLILIFMLLYKLSDNERCLKTPK
ncbi:unnamed protein product [Tenebrio molitor]|nr:unnamed protein product [Tenebrio molitor]